MSIVRIGKYALLTLFALILGYVLWIEMKNTATCRYVIRAQNHAYSTNSFVKDANGCLHFTEPGLGLKHTVCGNYTITEDE